MNAPKSSTMRNEETTHTTVVGRIYIGKSLPRSMHNNPKIRTSSLLSLTLLLAESKCRAK